MQTACTSAASEPACCAVCTSQSTRDLKLLILPKRRTHEVPAAVKLDFFSLCSCPVASSITEEPNLLVSACSDHRFQSACRAGAGLAGVCMQVSVS